MVPLSALDQTKVPAGLQYLASFVAINSTDFPAISTTIWDNEPLDVGRPAVSSIQIFPRYAQLIYSINIPGN